MGCLRQNLRDLHRDGVVHWTGVQQPHYRSAIDDHPKQGNDVRDVWAVLPLPVLINWLKRHNFAYVQVFNDARDQFAVT